jgi:hypothetical protein
MEPNIIDEGCDMLMNEREIQMQARTKGLKKFQVVNQKMMIQCN